MISGSWSCSNILIIRKFPIPFSKHYASKGKKYSSIRNKNDSSNEVSGYNFAAKISKAFKNCWNSILPTWFVFYRLRWFAGLKFSLLAGRFLFFPDPVNLQKIKSTSTRFMYLRSPYYMLWLGVILEETGKFSKTYCFMSPESFKILTSLLDLSLVVLRGSPKLQ